MQTEKEIEEEFSEKTKNLMQVRNSTIETANAQFDADYAKVVEIYKSKIHQLLQG